MEEGGQGKADKEEKGEESHDAKMSNRAGNPMESGEKLSYEVGALLQMCDLWWRGRGPLVPARAQIALGPYFFRTRSYSGLMQRAFH